MKPTKLFKPHGTNRFCGPTVLSALTGLSTDDCAAVARTLRERRAVKGMQDWELMATLRKLGGQAFHYAHNGARQSLELWMESRSETQRKKLYVVTVSEHYVLVRGDLVLCSWTRGEWMHILSHPFRNKRFVSAILVEPPAKKATLPKQVTQERRATKKVYAARARGKAEAERLAKALHLEFERDDGLIITSLARSGHEMWRGLLIKAGLEVAPDAGFDVVNDEFYNEVLCGDSYGHNWGEALYVVERVQEYAAAQGWK